MGATYSLQGPSPAFMRGAGGSLSAQWETNNLLQDTYIYMYPAGSDAYVERRAVFGGAGKSGSVQFDSSKLACGKSYIFRWYTGRSYFATKLAESAPFEVQDFEEVVRRQVQAGVQMADSGEETRALKRRVAELEEELRSSRRVRPRTFGTKKTPQGKGKGKGKGKGAKASESESESEDESASGSGSGSGSGSASASGSGSGIEEEDEDGR